MNISAVQTSHATVVVAIEFEKFISTFESLLGKYDPTVEAQIRKDPQIADRMLQAMEGEQKLMIFWRLNHGGLFSLIGQPCNSMRYTIGNPRIALQMTRHDVRAALYVPFNLLAKMTMVRSEWSMTCHHQCSASLATRMFCKSRRSSTERSRGSLTQRPGQQPYREQMSLLPLERSNLAFAWCVARRPSAT
jgi:hypothetical protein